MGPPQVFTTKETDEMQTRDSAAALLSSFLSSQARSQHDINNTHASQGEQAMFRTAELTGTSEVQHLPPGRKASLEKRKPKGRSSLEIRVGASSQAAARRSLSKQRSRNTQQRAPTVTPASLLHTAYTLHTLFHSIDQFRYNQLGTRGQDAEKKNRR